MRRIVGLVVLGVVVLVAASCIPTFPVDATADARSVDRLPVLSWTDATIEGDGESIAGYRIEIDGTLAATIPAPHTFCTLLNLSSSTPHSIEVTALSAKGAESQEPLTTSITPPSYYGDGGSPTCVTGNDADGDGLLDEVETGTGTFVSVSDTGTSPKKVDTDGDALGDREEVEGTAGGLDLPSFGVSPTKKDLLIEHDWFDDTLDCGAHTHRPTEATIDRFTQAFAAAPVANPDGTTGINAVVDYGQGGPFTGGNLVPDADGRLSTDIDGTDYLSHKAAHFASNRSGYFHYTLGVHNIYVTSFSSGVAEFDGDDLVVSLQCYLGTEDVSNTLAHELGHNLGLQHGGDTPTNDKPNYNSVMNYRFQFAGVDTNCDATGDGVLDFSSGTRITIDEHAILESDGVCGASPLDVNGNGSIDAAPLAFDWNADFTKGVLTDHDDWSALDFGGIGDADGASPVAPSGPELIVEQPHPGS